MCKDACNECPGSCDEKSSSCGSTPLPWYEKKSIGTKVGSGLAGGGLFATVGTAFGIAAALNPIGLAVAGSVSLLKHAPTVYLGLFIHLLALGTFVQHVLWGKHQIKDPHTCVNLF